MPRLKPNSGHTRGYPIPITRLIGTRHHHRPIPFARYFRSQSQNEQRLGRRRCARIIPLRRFGFGFRPGFARTNSIPHCTAVFRLKWIGNAMPNLYRFWGPRRRQRSLHNPECPSRPSYPPRDCRGRPRRVHSHQSDRRGRRKEISRQTSMDSKSLWPRGISGKLCSGPHCPRIPSWGPLLAMGLSISIMRRNFPTTFISSSAKAIGTRDWSCVRPPRIESRNVAVVGKTTNRVTMLLAAPVQRPRCPQHPPGRSLSQCLNHPAAKPRFAWPFPELTRVAT